MSRRAFRVRAASQVHFFPDTRAFALRLARAAGIRRVLSSDTIPHPTNAIPVAPLLARALAGSAR